jgi:hypothetical protein
MATPITGKQVRRAPGKAAAAVTQRKSYTGAHMLTAEFMVGVLIVAVRAVADYVPSNDGTSKGKIVPSKTGQYGPLPVLSGLIVSFFLLSFLAASGGTKAKLAVIGGAILDLALLMNSMDQFNTVAAVYSTFGKATPPPGDWQTSGSAAGSPLSVTAESGDPGTGNAHASTGTSTTPPVATA